VIESRSKNLDEITREFSIITRTPIEKAIWRLHPNFLEIWYVRGAREVPRMQGNNRRPNIGTFNLYGSPMEE